MFIWTISDAVTVVILGLFAIAFLFAWGGVALRQWRCKHDNGVTETMACDAICRKCGKNLGFIGNLVMDQRAQGAYSRARHLLYADGFRERFMGEPEPLTLGLVEGSGASTRDYGTGS